MIRLEAARSGTLSSVRDRLRRQLGSRVEAGVVAAANVLREQSLLIVPRDTGALAASCFVRQEGEGFTTVAVVGYGQQGFTFTGFSAWENKEITRHPFDYAGWQHDIPRFQHDAGQTYEFLKRPRDECQPLMRQALRAAAGL